MRILGTLYDAYIKSYDLDRDLDKEFFDVVEKEYFSDEVQGLKIYPQHSEINRLQHITSVAYISYLISKKMKWNSRPITRAAVLHDLFYYDWHENDWSHRPHGHRHPGFALKNARELCGDLTKQEENAIRRHMWPLTPTPPRYKEGFVVVFADKYCATQELLMSYVPRFDKRFKVNRAIMETAIRKLKGNLPEK